MSSDTFDTVTVSTTTTSTDQLPLDWTRLGQQCCEDPISCRQRHRTPLTSRGTVVRGHAVFCMHENDPSWFQGYFIPDHSRRPWGMLAVQEEVEDCLACADGGFRRIALTIYPPDPMEPIRLRTVDWTGGDMIQLKHERLDMEAHRLWTGPSSLSYVQRYFQGLISKLRQEYNVDESTSVLEWLPDVAVVVGTMTLVPQVSINEELELDSDM